MAMATTEERGQLMLMLMLLLMLMPTMATPMPMAMLLPYYDILLLVTTLARGLLMLSLPMAMDTEAMVDTEDTTEERGLPMLMPMPTMATPMPMAMLLPTMDILLLVTTLARGQLMLSLPMAMDTEVMVDTMAEDTTEERGLPMLMPMPMPTMATPMPMAMLLPTMDILLLVT